MSGYVPMIVYARVYGKQCMRHRKKISTLCSSVRKGKRRSQELHSSEDVHSYSFYIPTIAQTGKRKRYQFKHPIFQMKRANSFIYILIAIASPCLPPLCWKNRRNCKYCNCARRALLGYDHQHKALLYTHWHLPLFISSFCGGLINAWLFQNNNNENKQTNKQIKNNISLHI